MSYYVISSKYNNIINTNRSDRKEKLDRRRKERMKVRRTDNTSSKEINKIHFSFFSRKLLQIVYEI